MRSSSGNCLTKYTHVIVGHDTGAIEEVGHKVGLTREEHKENSLSYQRLVLPASNSKSRLRLWPCLLLEKSDKYERLFEISLVYAPMLALARE